MTHRPSGPVIAVVGATASGKSRLSLYLADRFNGEIVNADSLQLYRYMDIGTAKPSPQEQAFVPHHLIDIVSPDEEFSLQRYLVLAGRALADIWTRGRVAFLAGGTGQYVWGLLEGWQVPRVAPDWELRRSLEERARREGVESLHRELAEADPQAAAKIDPRNMRRVIRALEVYRLTGRPAASRRKLQPEFQSLMLGIEWPRTELYRRIDQRVDFMMEAGLVDEVRGLIDRGYGCHLPSMSSIGYRQACALLAGEMSEIEAVANMKTENHRLARAQATWFRREDMRIRWLPGGHELDQRAAEIVEAFLSGEMALE